MQSMRALLREHPRHWRDFSLVYPVISRRAGGLSIGINLCPNGECNFACVYCLVDRQTQQPHRVFDLGTLQRELNVMLDLACSGAIWQQEPFVNTSPSYRRLADITIAGDGEPTIRTDLAEIIRMIGIAKVAHGMSQPIVLMTNASRLHLPHVVDALAELDRLSSEVWIKLDAAEPNMYREINASKVPLDLIFRNIRDCGRARPVVIQTILLRWKGRAMTDAQFGAYIAQLEDLIAGGCRIQRVQLYTLARSAFNADVAPLEDVAMDHFARMLNNRVPGLDIGVFGAP